MSRNKGACMKLKVLIKRRNRTDCVGYFIRQEGEIAIVEVNDREMEIPINDIYWVVKVKK